ncbi:hypothetical protein [Bacillus sp. SM2101]|uniref:hypothetical protein n=1 Tax=Bacillus sp. SM2101 TaxID=2805366 RepID=UPI001BDE4FB9|nr:hypothetical protein [Bacillus sp. SM2101]
MKDLKKLPSDDKKLHPLYIHKKAIIEDLKIKHEPFVLYGDKAVAFVKEHVPEFKNKSEKKIYKNNGIFLGKNLPKEYTSAGVVCVFNGEIGTLAHELCHAKQFQDNNKWIHCGKLLNLIKKIIYPYYSIEKEAFSYAVYYLKKSNEEQSARVYQKKYRSIKFRKLSFVFFVPIMILFYLITVYISDYFFNLITLFISYFMLYSKYSLLLCLEDVVNI